DPVPVLPAVLLELHRVEEDETVGGGPLGQVSEPRQIVRLVDGDLHAGCSSAGPRRLCAAWTALRAALRPARGAPRPTPCPLACGRLTRPPGGAGRSGWTGCRRSGDPAPPAAGRRECRRTPPGARSRAASCRSRPGPHRRS